ncbi:hypothetical protein ACODM8_12525 [Vibrio ostreicida]|uniref:hypothetical protein n=1 Tax=Vibrio ostreicida TaxID=526588 RepID=UPI003B5CDD14
MTMPVFCSLENVKNNQFRCHRATKFESGYASPKCLFRLLPQGGHIYAIQSVDTGQFYQSHISRMVDFVDGDDQLWDILPIPGQTHIYTIRNLGNNQYMTQKASQLHSGMPSESEHWIVESRDDLGQKLGDSFYGFLKNDETAEYRSELATQMEKTPQIPHCLMKFIRFSDGTFAIQNQSNYEFYQNHITSMAKDVTSSGQKWSLDKVDDAINTYYLRNVLSGEYMTHRASQRHTGVPGPSEMWVIEEYQCLQTAGWMGANMPLLANQRLCDICIPGSHDSGTYQQIDSTRYGTVAATKTQIFDIQMQLMQGVRQLDLRPAWWNAAFYTAHYTDIEEGSEFANAFGAGFQGAVGVALSDAFAQINAFYSDPNHSQELLIVKFSHFIDWDRRDTGGAHNVSLRQKQNFVSLVKRTLGKRLIKLTEDTENLCVLTVKGLLGHGNILAIFPDDFSEVVSGQEGLWCEHQLASRGESSITNDLLKMIDSPLKPLGQKQNMEQSSHIEAPFMMNLSWQLTQDQKQAMSAALFSTPTLLNLADNANLALSPTLSIWLGDNTINHRYYPNVLQTDACFEETTNAVYESLTLCKLIQRFNQTRSAQSDAEVAHAFHCV